MTDRELSGDDGRRRWVILSPHFDDAVLSCGGSIARAARLGHATLVVTVCAAVPAAGADVSPYASALLERWSEAVDEKPMTAAAAVARRRAEDELALRVVGAEGRWLAVPDAIYRRDVGGAWPYADDARLFGTLDPADDEALADLARQLGAMPELARADGVVAPLAAGGHVDHRMVRRAAEAAVPPERLWYFEDYPYAAADGAVAEAVGSSPGWRRRCVRLGAADLAVKVSAAGAYASQVTTFWDDAEAMARSIAAFAAGRGSDNPVECFWRRSRA